MVHGQMQPVVLIEVPDLGARRFERDDAQGAGSDPTRVGPSGQRHATPRARSRRRFVAAVIAVALVLGAAASDLRARQRIARLVALPGVLAAADPSLHELWRLRQRGWGQFVGVGGALLLFGPDAAGAFAVELVDASAGTPVWTVPLPDVTSTGSVACVPVPARAADAPPRVVCAVVEGVTEATDGSGLERRSYLLVLDARSGALVADRALVSASAALAALGSDVVVTERRADGRAQITREDPETGRVRWTFRGDASPGPPQSSFDWLFPEVQNGVVVVHGPVTWAFDAEGTQLGVWRPQPAGSTSDGLAVDVTALPGGRFAVGQARGLGGGGAPYGTVSAAVGGHAFTIPGPVLLPAVDDGSAPSVLFTGVAGDTGIVATSLVTGRTLWSADPGAAFPGESLVLDGRFIVMLGRQLHAFDALSGQLLWSASVPMGNGSHQVLTDGRVVLVPIFDPLAGLMLTAFDPSDGRREWVGQLPAGINALDVVNGRLLGLTGDEVIALG